MRRLRSDRQVYRRAAMRSNAASKTRLGNFADQSGARTLSTQVEKPGSRDKDALWLEKLLECTVG